MSTSTPAHPPASSEPSTGIGCASLAKKGEIVVSAVGGRPPSYPQEIGAEASACVDLPALVEAMVAHWQKAIEPVLPDSPDLIVLPEMCDRYVGTPPEVLAQIRPLMREAMGAFLSSLAARQRCYIVHPTAAPTADGRWQNVATLYDRSGHEVASYAKMFLTPNEIQRGLVPGQGAVVHDCDFGRIGFAICFDLNFTELLEQYAALGVDLLVFPSYYHGGLMQAYWAYRAQAHLVTSMGMPALFSEVRSPLGVTLAASTNYFPHVTTRINLDCKLVHLDFNWEKLDALKLRYGREVCVSDPGELGAVLVSSYHPEVSVAQMLAEFSIEPLSGYLSRSAALNSTAR